MDIHLRALLPNSASLLKSHEMGRGRGARAQDCPSHPTLIDLKAGCNESMVCWFDACHPGLLLGTEAPTMH